MQIIVPASSANLGPGFDSIGVALSLLLTVDVLGPATSWQVDHQLADLPHDESNLIVQTARHLIPDLTPHHLAVQSDIPVAHGLGSSSSAIVAGIELANQLGALHLSNEQKVAFACQLEGHPDNVAPTILGGLVIGTEVNGGFAAVKAPLPPYLFAAYIPAYNVKTKEAVAASATANTLVAALFTGDYQLVGQLIEQDRFHEQARAHLVPELTQLRELGHRCGALATYLSGAGPTVMTLLKEADFPAFQAAIAQAGLPGRLVPLTPHPTGVTVS
ncbi:homoserine kinase [Limosilactobacillus fermentum]|uniref:homoserine kinase n=1 Tax=Limosilactobacillus fermentum TaxID=1613 RepID=UPI00234B8C98|nr:homoserine kinase [Limosilactobacillus fermentum]MDC6078606.1 homoserine kinase [Limosilactobacillus fermentum]